MGLDLRRRRGWHRQGRTPGGEPADARDAIVANLVCLTLETQIHLAPGHRQIDIGENLGIEQPPV